MEADPTSFLLILTVVMGKIDDFVNKILTQLLWITHQIKLTIVNLIRISKYPHYNTVIFFIS